MSIQKELKTQGDFLFKYRSFLPILFVLWGMGVVCVDVYFGKGHFSSNRIQLSALIIGSIGKLIRMHVIGYSASDTSGRNTKTGQVAGSLNTVGWYSMCRNPLYLGNFLMWISVCVLTENLWFCGLFTLVFWLYYERIIYTEELFLTQKFNTDYSDWASKTPCFIPNLLQYRAPKQSFSFKKVFNKERSGVMGLFVVLYLFSIFRSWVNNQTLEIDTGLLFYCAVFGVGFYITSKTLKKTTSLLEY